MKAAPLQQVSLVGIPFEKVTSEFIGPLSPPTDKHHRWVLTLVYFATRYPEVIHLSSTTTEIVAEGLLSTA